jgi:Uma2 family endonuclease
MGTAATLIPVEEYLRTNYDPDREYVDGEVVERNLGEKTHSTIQGNLIYYFRLRRDEWGIRAYPEQRVQVSRTRFRIPDVTVVKLSQEQGEIFTNPPHLCIEILSKDDTMQYMLEKIDDYLNFGVPYVWIISPENRKGSVVTPERMVDAKSGVLETKDPLISMPLAVLFE